MATITQLLAFLGISSPTPEMLIKLEMILDASWGVVVAHIGDLRSQQYTLYTRDCYCCCGLELLVDHINVTSLDEINGQAYTGVLGTDYRIQGPNQRKIVIRNFLPSIPPSQFCDLEVKYTAGFDPLPDDIVYAQLLIAQSERAKKDGKDIEQYKLRERMVKFATDPNSKEYSYLKSIFGKYTISGIYSFGP